MRPPSRRIARGRCIDAFAAHPITTVARQLGGIAFDDDLFVGGATVVGAHCVARAVTSDATCGQIEGCCCKRSSTGDLASGRICVGGTLVQRMVINGHNGDTTFVLAHGATLA